MDVQILLYIENMFLDEGFSVFISRKCSLERDCFLTENFIPEKDLKTKFPVLLPNFQGNQFGQFLIDILRTLGFLI